jgi:signal transduction histidine kinase
MIVRIQGEGQWELSDAQIKEIDKIDDQVVEVVRGHDERRFEGLVKQMLDYVRSKGRALKPEEIVESDLILPPADATIDEVKSLFEHEGLIVG